MLDMRLVNLTEPASCSSFISIKIEEMKVNALRRLTRTDMRESDLMSQMQMQTHFAHQAGEISDEMHESMLLILQRCHAGLAIRTGVLDRARMRRFERRCKHLGIPTQFDIITAVMVFGLLVLWFILL